MTLTFDLWPWKPFQQCPLTWWIFVPSFIEIHPLSTEMSHHAKRVLTDGWRKTGKHSASRRLLSAGKALCRILTYFSQSLLFWFSALWSRQRTVWLVSPRDVRLSQSYTPQFHILYRISSHWDNTLALLCGEFFLSIWSVIFKATNAKPQLALFRVTNIWRNATLPAVRCRSFTFYKVVWWYFSGVVGKRVAVCFFSEIT